MTDKKQVYNKEILDEILKRDVATLVGEEGYNKINARTTIKYTCKCGRDDKKTMPNVVLTGLKCRVCLTDTRRYDIGLLQEIIIRDKAELLEKYSNLNRDTPIKFKCSCGIEHKNIFRYLVENAGVFCKSCTEKIRQQKTIQSNQEIRGCNYPTQSLEVREKSEQTCLIKFGVKNPGQSDTIKDKAKNTNVERYGVPFTFQADSVKQRIIETNKLRYGVQYPMQNSEILERALLSAKKLKPYIMPSGEVRMIQGYENFALDILVKDYDEEEIKTESKDKPSIKYEFEGKSHIYHPDILITSNNLIIEVKSRYTYENEEEINIVKMNATISNGYKFEFWCFDAKGKRISI
jgi:hypothetical protein